VIQKLEAIGIDFGTTNTVASARIDGKVKTLSLEKRVE
jgi:molecular chaperone DnaK (HSP70)